MATKSCRRRGRGEGSIFQRKSDGYYVAELFLGYDERGKRRIWRKYGQTRQAVAAALAAAQVAHRQGTLREGQRGTVADYLNWWLNVTQPTLAPTTWRRYSELVQHHLVPEVGHYRLAALRPEHIQALATAKLAQGLSPQTVKHSRLSEDGAQPRRTTGPRGPQRGGAGQAAHRAALSVARAAARGAAPAPHDSRRHRV